MMFNVKKFNKEIAALAGLKNSGDVLTPQEQNQIKAQILKAIAEPAAASAPGYFWTARRQKIARYISTVILGLSLVGGTAFASSGAAKPGDLLYPLKRTKEKVWLNLAVSEELKASLKAKFAQERLKELNELLIDQSTTNDSSSVNQASGANATATPGHIKAVNSGTLNNKHLLQMAAKQEAGTEVSQALQALEQVQTKLEANGNTQAAISVKDNILELRGQAQLQHVDVDAKNSNDINNNNAKPLRIDHQDENRDSGSDANSNLIQNINAGAESTTTGQTGVKINSDLEQ